MKISKLNKQLVAQVEPFVTQLPSNSLLEYAKTQDLIEEWLETKDYAIWLGKCLKARFGGGGGNPAKKALNAGQIDQFDYTEMLAIVEVYTIRFALVQTAWEEIQESISCIENSPKSETDLFLEILREAFDRLFMEVVQGCKRSASNSELLAKIARNAIWRHSGDKDWAGGLTPEEFTIVASLISKKNDFSWGSLVDAICKEAAKEDIEIKRQLQRYNAAVGRVCDLLLQAHRRERSPNPPGKIKSKKWENGRCRLGKKGGFEPLSADSPIVSVTELNETISHIVRRSSQF